MRFPLGVESWNSRKYQDPSHFFACLWKEWGAPKNCRNKEEWWTHIVYLTKLRRTHTVYNSWPDCHFLSNCIWHIQLEAYPRSCQPYPQYLSLSFPHQPLLPIYASHSVTFQSIVCLVYQQLYHLSGVSKSRRSLIRGFLRSPHLTFGPHGPGPWDRTEFPSHLLY